MRIRPASMDTKEYLRKMRDDWDKRARQSAHFFIADGRTDWSEEEFYASGDDTVAQDILTDMTNICQGREPRQMRVLELGCGAGRVTRALARIFGEVHAVDVSPEMVRLARAAVADSPNAFIHLTDGAGLSVLGDLRFDFAYSCCVFHHISSYDVIQSYVREVGRRLPPKALFKFEVQGCTHITSTPGDTWIGVPFSLKQAGRMAKKCGFELRHHVGEGQERFWLWCFKR
jgi:SAM-dependent methyltransferase